MALIITMFVCGVQTTGTHYQDTVCVSWQVTIFACKPLKSRQQFIRTLYLGVLISDNSHMICSWLIYGKWFHLQPWQLHTHVIFITTVIGKQSGFEASLLPTTYPTQGTVWLVPTSLNLSTCGCNGIPSKTTTCTHTLWLCLSQNTSKYISMSRYRTSGSSFESCFGTVWNSIYAECSLEPTHELGQRIISKPQRMFWHNRWDVHACVRSVLQSRLQKMWFVQPSL